MNVNKIVSSFAEKSSFKFYPTFRHFFSRKRNIFETNKTYKYNRSQSYMNFSFMILQGFIHVNGKGTCSGDINVFRR